MSRPVPQLNEPEPGSSRYQFGMLTILILMTAIAIVVGILRPIPVPPAWGPYVWGTTIVWVVFLVMRTAYIVRRLKAERLRLRSHRADLLNWANEARSAPRNADKAELGPDEKT